MLHNVDAVIDLERNVQDDPDALLTPGDVLAIEAAHGTAPGRRIEGAGGGPARV